MNPLYLSRAALACFDVPYAGGNDFGGPTAGTNAFIPELWAAEGLAILQENMVIANLVHRDFENEIRQFGDVVNTRRPGNFQIRRKQDGTALANQAANATNVRVPLDQWFYTSFTIKDGEASKSFQDLVDIYLRPGMITIARSVDRAVLGRVHGFLGNPTQRVGRLNNLTAANSKDYVLEARERLNVQKAPLEGRNLVLAPVSETSLLKNELFIAAQQRGDFGTALESATLGRILGFDTYMDQNVNSVSLGSADVDTSATLDDAVAAGATVSAGAVTAGSATAASTTSNEFVVVAGNDQPTYLVASGASLATITLNEANKYATQAAAPMAVYNACDVGATQAAGWVEQVVVDGFTAPGVAPAVGQLIAFQTGTKGYGATRHTYTIIESYRSLVDGTPDANGTYQALYLDRPLDYGITDDDKCYPGPAGALNLAFHRNAIALVTRPLAIPNNAMGVLSHVGVYNDIAMRVSMQYSIQQGGTVVNLDLLAGVAILDTNLAVVLQG
jgi:hypothetical protein